ncbi:MAG: NAD(P)H-hydrate dehydratase [Proteobacteria bacterium]|nr:NAD(P)H-hydrate dehydratase [Pseudomonadota bacterium]
MRYVVTAQEMRQLDAMTIDEIGLPGAVLMETAGRAVVRVVRDLLDELPSRAARVAVVCGAGNNGGDGYVIARCLRGHGVDATVYLATDQDRLSGDARLHFDVYRKLDGRVVSIADNRSLAEHAAAITSADLVIDAVFGTGLSRAISGHYGQVIETINQSRGIVVAVDIPSGLMADTGQILGPAVEAAHTVTMAFLKIGLVSAPGFVRSGTVHIAEIGIPESLARDRGVSVQLLETADLAALVPAVSPLDHKNRRGHVLAAAGSPGKRGAARLLAWAALRSGAGLVTVAAPWSSTGSDRELQVPDPVMTARLDSDGRNADPVRSLVELCNGKRVLAIGPGMPTSPGGKALVCGALAEIEVPAVLDADALNHVADDLGRVARARCPVVMTPHPGEAARLLASTTADIERDRVHAIRRLASQSRAVVVLKGPRTLVCDGRDDSAQVTINPSGGPALATAGSGDVLTGIIAALIAQNLDPGDAARLGVYLHGRAGDRAAQTLGPRSVTAADLADHLPFAFAELDAASPVKDSGHRSEQAIRSDF